MIMCDSENFNEYEEYEKYKCIFFDTSCEGKNCEECEEYLLKEGVPDDF